MSNRKQIYTQLKKKYLRRYRISRFILYPFLSMVLGAFFIFVFNNFGEIFNLSEPRFMILKTGNRVEQPILVTLFLLLLLLFLWLLSGLASLVYFIRSFSLMNYDSTIELWNLFRMSQKAQRRKHLRLKAEQLRAKARKHR